MKRERTKPCWHKYSNFSFFSFVFVNLHWVGILFESECKYWRKVELWVSEIGRRALPRCFWMGENTTNQIKSIEIKTSRNFSIIIKSRFSINETLSDRTRCCPLFSEFLWLSVLPKRFATPKHYPFQHYFTHRLVHRQVPVSAVLETVKSSKGAASIERKANHGGQNCTTQFLLAWFHSICCAIRLIQSHCKLVDQRAPFPLNTFEITRDHHRTNATQHSTAAACSRKQSALVCRFVNWCGWTVNSPSIQYEHHKHTKPYTAYSAISFTHFAHIQFN